MKYLFTIILSVIFTFGVKAQEFTPNNSTWQNPETEWFYKAKIGAFTHFLIGNDFLEHPDLYDVEGVANQLKEAGVSYFFITLGQNSGYFIAPNPVYEQLAGYKPGERCSKRDIPMELAKALKKRGIRLMLYLPCQTPNKDMQAATKLGFPGEPVNEDRNMRPEGVKNWAKVISWWSKHYGKNICGWWFDGGYAWCDFNSNVAAIYAKAAKAGNPHSIVTFNPGISLKRATTAEDYTAGEINNPLKETTPGRWIDGSQAHILTYFGDTWGNHNVRYTDDEWINWIKSFTGKGGVVTIDMAVNFDTSKGRLGLIDEKQLQQLKHICAALK